MIVLSSFVHQCSINSLTSNVEISASILRILIKFSYPAQSVPSRNCVNLVNMFRSKVEAVKVSKIQGGSKK